MKTRKYLCWLFSFFTLLTMWDKSSGQQHSCCIRSIGILGDVAVGVEFEGLDCPPLDIEFISVAGLANLNKLVNDILEAVGSPPSPEQLQLEEMNLDLDYFIIENHLYNKDSDHFDLYLQLVDVRRARVVKSVEGSVTEMENFRKAIGQLIKSFVPLNELIYEYEKMPESCLIEPEQEKIPAGEEMTINLNDIFDGKGRLAQPWQFVLVKCVKGNILNGVPQYDGEYYRFPVGGQAKVVIQYKAPDECKNQTETIQVYNSCQNDLRAFTTGLIPKTEIAIKKFKIYCPAAIEVQYNQVYWSEKLEKEYGIPPSTKQTIRLRKEKESNRISGHGLIKYDHSIPQKSIWPDNPRFLDEMELDFEGKIDKINHRLDLVVKIKSLKNYVKNHNVFEAFGLVLGKGVLTADFYYPCEFELTFDLEKPQTEKRLLISDRYLWTFSLIPGDLNDL